MNQEKGFSLIEVMIAGAIAIGIMTAVYQFVTNVGKNAAELEKRTRFRDLVNDIRFVFSHPPLCVSSFKGEFKEGALAEVKLGRGLVVKEGAQLREYGLEINVFRLENIENFPRMNHTLINSYGGTSGQYWEESSVGELRISASLIGGGLAPKPMTVTRVLQLRRGGAITEEYCRGNVEIAGGVGSSAGDENSRSANPSEPRISAGSRPPSQGNRSNADCMLTGELATLSGRSKLVQGETVWIDGGRGRVQCDERGANLFRQ